MSSGDPTDVALIVPPKPTYPAIAWPAPSPHGCWRMNKPDWKPQRFWSWHMLIWMVVFGTPVGVLVGAAGAYDASYNDWQSFTIDSDYSHNYEHVVWIVLAVAGVTLLFQCWFWLTRNHPGLDAAANVALAATTAKDGHLLRAGYFGYSAVGAYAQMTEKSKYAFYERGIPYPGCEYTFVPYGPGNPMTPGALPPALGRQASAYATALPKAATAQDRYQAQQYVRQVEAAAVGALVVAEAAHVARDHRAERQQRKQAERTATLVEYQARMAAYQGEVAQANAKHTAAMGQYQADLARWQSKPDGRRGAMPQPPPAPRMPFMPSKPWGL